MHIALNFPKKVVEVNGEARFGLRRNFNLYDVRDLQSGKYVITNTPKEELQVAVERMVSRANQ
jgi:hypothetical protein